jgi:TRAP-type mannitol/chloroaromatic compound transport system permease small subunit
MDAVTRIADGLDRIIDRIGRLTGWFAFALVCVMAYNVLLRYFFRTGSVAMQELEWHLMAPICLLGLSYALLHDGHVKVDIFYGRFPYRVRKLIDVVSMILVCAVVGLLMVLSLPYVEQSYAIGEKSPDPGGLEHRWVLKAMLPLGFGLLLIQSVAATLRALVALLGPEPPEPAAGPATWTATDGDPKAAP